VGRIADRGGYDLGKFYALEEFYSQDLEGYYDPLVTHPHHNYYEGGNTAEITLWLAYFLKGMSAVFESVTREVREQAVHSDDTSEAFLRNLDRRGRIVLGLFSRQDEISARDVAQVLGLSDRQVRNLLTEWVAAGWLEVSDASRKAHAYRLPEKYRQFIGNLSAR
jgi:Fic family protein